MPDNKQDAGKRQDNPNKHPGGNDEGQRGREGDHDASKQTDTRQGEQGKRDTGGGQSQTERR